MRSGNCRFKPAVKSLNCLVNATAAAMSFGLKNVPGLEQLKILFSIVLASMKARCVPSVQLGGAALPSGPGVHPAATTA